VRAHVESAFLEAGCASLLRMGTSFQQALEHRMQLQINHITEGHKKRSINTELLGHYTGTQPMGYGTYVVAL